MWHNLYDFVKNRTYYRIFLPNTKLINRFSNWKIDLNRTKNWSLKLTHQDLLLFHSSSTSKKLVVHLVRYHPSYSIDRLNSGFFSNFGSSEWNYNLSISGWRASKINWNDIKSVAISWKFNIENPFFCVGIWVGGHHPTNF